MRKIHMKKKKYLTHEILSMDGTPLIYMSNEELKKEIDEINIILNDRKRR